MADRIHYRRAKFGQAESNHEPDPCRPTLAGRCRQPFGVLGGRSALPRCARWPGSNHADDGTRRAIGVRWFSHPSNVRAGNGGVIRAPRLVFIIEAPATHGHRFVVSFTAVLTAISANSNSFRRSDTDEDSRFGTQRSHCAPA